MSREDSLELLLITFTVLSASQLIHPCFWYGIPRKEAEQ